MWAAFRELQCCSINIHNPWAWYYVQNGMKSFQMAWKVFKITWKVFKITWKVFKITWTVQNNMKSVQNNMKSVQNIMIVCPNELCYVHRYMRIIQNDMKYAGYKIKHECVQIWRTMFQLN